MIKLMRSCLYAINVSFVPEIQVVFTSKALTLNHDNYDPFYKLEVRQAKFNSWKGLNELLPG